MQFVPQNLSMPIFYKAFARSAHARLTDAGCPRIACAACSRTRGLAGKARANVFAICARGREFHDQFQGVNGASFPVFWIPCKPLEVGFAPSRFYIRFWIAVQVVFFYIAKASSIR